MSDNERKSTLEGRQPISAAFESVPDKAKMFRVLFAVLLVVTIFGGALHAAAIVNITQPAHRPVLPSWMLELPMSAAVAIVQWIVSLTLLYNWWQLIQRTSGGASPAKMVGSLLIPGFNLVWMFTALGSLPNCLNQHAAVYGIRIRRASSLWMMIYLFSVILWLFCIGTFWFVTTKGRNIWQGHRPPLWFSIVALLSAYGTLALMVVLPLLKLGAFYRAHCAAVDIAES